MAADRQSHAAEMRDLIEACERALADAERIIESRTGRGSWVGSLVLARVRESQAASRGENKLAVAFAARHAMQQHRKGKPIAFQPRTRP